MINKIRIEVAYLNKELKKLNRKELLEILLEQTKRIEELETEVDNLKNKKTHMKTINTYIKKCIKKKKSTNTKKK